MAKQRKKNKKYKTLLKFDKSYYRMILINLVK